jgi:hypothetical protein
LIVGRYEKGEACRQMESYVVLPETDHGKALLSKRGGHGAVTFLGEKELGLPEPRVRLGDMATVRAAMPKAAVYEHSQRDLWKEEVRPALYF